MKKKFKLLGVFLFVYPGLIFSQGETFGPGLKQLNSRNAISNVETKIFQEQVPTNGGYTDIDFADENSGIVVGKDGILLITTDGGQTWNQVSPTSETDFEAVTFYDENHAWAVGSAGAIYFWNGTQWTALDAGVTSSFKDVHFCDENNGWITYGKNVLVTSDGGENWQLSETGSNDYLVGVFLLAPDNGWAFGGGYLRSSTLVHWDGSAWINVTPSDIKNYIWDMDFVNAACGWFVGYSNILFCTADSGKTWESQQIESSTGQLYKVDFVNEITGWIITLNGEIFHTNDGGANWIQQYKSEDQLSGISFFNEHSGFVLGKSGTLFYTENDGSSWLPIEIDLETMVLGYVKGAYAVKALIDVPEVKLWMHVPVIHRETSPICFKLLQTYPADKIIEYRTVNKGCDTWLAEVTFGAMVAGDSIFVPWESWVLKKKNMFTDMPDSIHISILGDLDDSLAQFVQSTRFIQSDSSEIISKAEELAGDETNLISIIETILYFTSHTIEYTNYGEQDALTTLRRGYSVCTGKANLAVALMRVFDIPARVLMVAQTHYIVEIFLPGYGWIRAESTIGKFPQPVEKNTVMLACSAEEEINSGTRGILAWWGTSNDSVLFGIMYDVFENSEEVATMTAGSGQAGFVVNQTIANWRDYNEYLNRDLSLIQQSLFSEAIAAQEEAVTAFSNSSVLEYMSCAQLVHDKFAQIEATGITPNREVQTLTDFQLYQNYPNPFNANTKIRFFISAPGPANLKIFNITGQGIRTLVDRVLPSGLQQIEWDGKNKAGEKVASGLYFIRLEKDGARQVRKMMLIN